MTGPQPTVVIGRRGQLAQALGEADPTVRLLGREAFDLATDDPHALLNRTHPAVVINAAAYTDVNGAETDSDAAQALNCDGPARLAAACAASGVRFLHVSTDYVFDGTGGAPYAEAAPTRPLNVYGRTKRDGEQAILDAAPEAFILRAAWIFDASGGSFLTAILNRFDAGQALKIVDDQISTPTWAPDLARALLDLRGAALTGLYHYSGGAQASWFDFGRAALELAAARSGTTVALDPVDSAAFPQPAQRPKDTRLDASALLAAAGVGPGNWRAGLKTVIDRRYSRAPASM